MNKLRIFVTIILGLIINVGVFGNEIGDYFLPQEGKKYKYVQEGVKGWREQYLSDQRSASTPDGIIYQFSITDDWVDEDGTAGILSKKKTYFRNKDIVLLAMVSSAFGERPLPEPQKILSLPWDTWRRIHENDPDEYYDYQSTKSSITVNGVKYNDCIRLLKITSYLEKNGRRKNITEDSYYAKGIGLVYWKVNKNEPLQLISID